jgi:hypothetical protein
MRGRDQSGTSSEKIIYTQIKRGQPYVIKAGGYFIPVFDSTDHFHFACQDCREIAEVIMVKRHDCYANTPTLYFYLHCPKCGKEDSRKIYLEDSGKHCMGIPSKMEPLAKTVDEAIEGIQTRELTFQPLGGFNRC